MVIKPGDEPGLTMPPVLFTEPVIVPDPSRRPPWSGNGWSNWRLPPDIRVVPDVWGEAPWYRSVPLSTFTRPWFVKTPLKLREVVPVLPDLVIVPKLFRLL